MRVKIVVLSYRFFYAALDFLEKGTWKTKVKNPLPADAKILRFDIMPTYAAIGVLVESASFDDIKDCEQIPLYRFELVSTPRRRKK